MNSVNCSVTLCCVAGGDTYLRYAECLAESASRFFRPSKSIEFLVIEGEQGWPNGTMYRWHRLLENMPDSSYVFLSDADMLFESKVGSEILSPHVTLTLHPGFVGRHPREFPYEKRVESVCHVDPIEGSLYFCGGFAGGPTKELKRFANEIVSRIDQDVSNGIIPVWHDESALNKAASVLRDLHILDPSYCHPDEDEYYVRLVWGRQYPRRLVALDKRAEERVGRS